MNSLNAGNQHRWVAPDRLDRSRPRFVKLTGRGRALVFFSVFLSLGGLGVAIGLNGIAARQSAEAALLSREGTIAEGKVYRTSRIRNERNQVLIDYSFIAGGRRYRKEIKVSGREWQRLTAGSPIAVRYARGRPELNYPLGLGPERVPEWLPGPIAVLLFLCGLFMLYPLRKQKHLLEYGRVTDGTVTRHGKVTKSSHGREIGTQYFYEFRLISGALREGKAIARVPPAIGSRIAILYDAEEARKNAPYPLPLVRPA
jgi:hypothetical protein